MTEFVTIVAIAIGLAMDSFAVSVVSGAVYRRMGIRHTLRMASFFGGFQALMPLAGYAAAVSVRDYIADYGHWVAFGLLSAVGGKMIYESFKLERSKRNYNPADTVMLLVLAVATSIDAFAIGVTLSLVTEYMVMAVVVIGLVTFILSCLGVYIGKKFGRFFESKVEVAGGIILIAIGFKILFEHIL